MVLVDCIFLGFPGGTVVKKPPANAGDMGDAGLIPGLGRSPVVRNGNLLQCTCLGNSRNLAGLQSMGLQRVRHD